MESRSKHADTPKVLFGSIGVLLLIWVFLFGFPIDTLSKLLPQWDPSEVATALNASYARRPWMEIRDFQCETGTQGWDFVCLAVRQPAAKTGKPASQVKFGVMNHRVYGPGQPVDLPTCVPTLSYDEVHRGGPDRHRLLRECEGRQPGHTAAVGSKN
jgi:hypothetical protein